MDFVLTYIVATDGYDLCKKSYALQIIFSFVLWALSVPWHLRPPYTNLPKSTIISPADFLNMANFIITGVSKLFTFYVVWFKGPNILEICKILATARNCPPKPVCRLTEFKRSFALIVPPFLLSTSFFVETFFCKALSLSNDEADNETFWIKIINAGRSCFFYGTKMQNADTPLLVDYCIGIAALIGLFWRYLFSLY